MCKILLKRFKMRRLRLWKSFVFFWPRCVLSELSQEKLGQKSKVRTVLKGWGLEDFKTVLNSDFWQSFTKDNSVEQFSKLSILFDFYSSFTWDYSDRRHKGHNKMVHFQKLTLYLEWSWAMSTDYGRVWPFRNSTLVLILG